MAETTVKKGNRYPPLESTLSESGKVINFKEPLKAIAVKLRIKKVGEAALEKAAEFVLEGEKGQVRYKWTKPDTETTGVLNVEGEYQYEWIVEWEAGPVLENFPTNGFKTLAVTSII